MSAIHAPRRRGRRPAALALGLVAALAIPAGCGGSSSDTGGPAQTNPKAAEQRRDMEKFMKGQKK